LSAATAAREYLPSGLIDGGGQTGSERFVDSDGLFVF
jgi:hypothetical protein